MYENVTAIIPAYNEEKNIRKTIEGLKKIEVIDEIIVVDDGSTDSTFNLVSAIEDIIVLKHDKNRGKGFAVKSALSHVGNRFVVLVDADLCESAYEIRLLLDKCCFNDNSVIVGKLPPPKRKGGFGIVKFTAAKGYKLLTSKEPMSVLSGQRVIPVRLLREIDIPNDFGLEFKLSVEAARRNYEIIEIPVNIRHRETGRDLKSFIHRGRQFKDIFRAILKEVR
ncbi:MAG: glycosyltransferase family 2 protein [Bacillota bacterium]